MSPAAGPPQTIVLPSSLTPLALDPATAALLRAKARQVARRCWLPAADRDDVEQELAAHVWPRLARFDPAKAARDTFVRMLVARAAATAIRRRRRRRVTDPLATALRLCGEDRVDPRAWPAPERAAGHALDVAAVLAAVPRRLRRTAAAVSRGSVAAAARGLGLGRATVYAHLAELRAHFEAAGLGPAGGNPKTSRTPRPRPG